jgi:two-component system response regulator HydG
MEALKGLPGAGPLVAGQGMVAEGMPPLQVLVVDDDEPVRRACSEVATRFGCVVMQAESVPAAQAILQYQKVDLLLLDLRLPGGGGLALLEQVKTRYAETTVVVMTAFATVGSAVEAMRIGAADYLTKPFALEQLQGVLERAAERRQLHLESRMLRERLRTAKGMGDMVGHSPEMEKLYRIVSKVTFSTHPVLILGESGTGKELVARTIHTNGPNAGKRFMPVDLSALTPQQIESELFGHVRGAFEGADRERDGLLTTLGGGTIYLNEIAALPLDLQSRLLRALQDKSARPMGSDRALPVTARVLAATSRDVVGLVEQGRFRKDLYFRLNVVTLRIPPLRERRTDIHALALHFLERIGRESGVTRMFSDEALRVMLEYGWPGNASELESAIERACALSSGPVVHMGDLPTQLQDFQMHRTQTARTAETEESELDGMLGVAPRRKGILSISELEKQAILGTIQQLKGDKLMAARLLGIGKTTLYRKLKEYGIGDGMDASSQGN